MEEDAWWGLIVRMELIRQWCQDWSSWEVNGRGEDEDLRVKWMVEGAWGA